jgi:hypothetical protein
MIATKQVKTISEKCVPPSDDYIVVNVFSWHEKDTEFYDLCPYYLKTDGNEEQINKGGVIFENFWQGSKVYPVVKPIEVYPHPSFRGNPKYLMWSYDKNEKHLDDKNNVLPEYFDWKKSLFDCKKPIRYPNSYGLRGTCKFALLIDKKGKQTKLDYISSRKRIYCQEYMRLVRNIQSYKKLLKLILNGEKICIFEVDVPTQNKKGLYGSYAEGNIFFATLDKIDKLLDDPSEPFGHGLCLAKALFEDYEKIKKSDIIKKDDVELKEEKPIKKAIKKMKH